MYKIKNWGLIMDHWWIPVLISAHDEYWPFKTTFCFLVVKNRLKETISHLKNHIGTIYKSFVLNFIRPLSDLEIFLVSNPSSNE